ncbi:MAG TPA: tRNA (guanosine(37)-N1)-methyltransferase TrmD [Hyphomonadaceae bacterium]|jgi:tRNA (guanine37-N1)-methyltransferase|nr:tRNA (guanosine(37)-N1)-methyltransferase TrmD [Hyphomonadaceae bacterium]
MTAAPFKATCLTLFPEAFPGLLGVSIVGSALQKGLWQLETVDIRTFGIGKHRNVDDTPAGGGAGMVMRADVAAAAIDSVEQAGRPRIFLSPRGKALTQARVRELAAGPGVILLCGRFEGLDERVIEGRGLEEVSLGDFVLAGGEVAAQALLEACIRLLPGVAGNADSLAEESFETGLLEHPQYTRPQTWEGWEIPAILTSGDHAKVAAYRRNQAEELTKARRPDLYAASRRPEASGNPNSRGAKAPPEADK